MGNSTKTHFGLRQSDGFATLTGSLLERKSIASPLRENERGAPERGGQRPSEGTPGGPSGREGQVTRQASNEENYTGRERRIRDVSPVIERRRSSPPRIKVSVRLESHRHDRLKAAALLRARTHQDLMTAALDFYLDHLNIPEMTGRRAVR